MPEGHALHRLAGQLNRHFGSGRISSASPQGRFAAGAERVDGRRWTGVEAHGKHLFLSFAGLTEQVHVHLGLYGKWTVTPSREVEPIGLIRWRLQSSRVTADLRGPTACELLDPHAVEMLHARLGPDPLRADARPDDAWRRIMVSRRTMATLLMDQTVLSGVGNIYRAEVLFRHCINPSLPGRDLARGQWEVLWADLVALMTTGVRDGRIDTVRPEHEPAAMGRPPRADDHGGEVYVYRRAGMPCLVCATPIAMSSVASRNLFWCPRCQPRR